MSRRLVLALAVAMGALAMSSAAHAESRGVVKGKLSFYQFSGGYCEASASTSCAGARYQKAQYGTKQPVRETIVYVVNAADGTNLGTGSADASGNFTVSWYSLSTLPAGTRAQISWIGYHRSGAYYIVKATDYNAVYSFKSPSFTITPGTTTASPQTVAEFVLGTSTAGNNLASLYEAAHLAWKAALEPSTRMKSNFTGVRIAAFGTFSECGASGSCATGSEKLVRINTNRAFTLSTPMHEMGHVASYQSDKHKGGFSNYCYPLTTCAYADNVHSATSNEWLAPAFEEGFATIVAAVGMWAPNATTPRVCDSTGACSGLNAETSFNTAACRTSDYRQEVQVTRYLWDLYDTVVDTTFDDSRSNPVSIFYDILAKYTPGGDNHDVNEPWNAALTAIDNLEGRSAGDYLYWTNQFLPGTAASQSLAFSANCLTQ
jgi:hypothetical protein